MSGQSLCFLLLLSSALVGCGTSNPDDETPCDGELDERCACVSGAQQACYGGPEGTRGVGVCLAGSQTCVDGAWGACEEAITPSEETCNGVDDDCDGVTDPGCDCADGAQQLCYTGPVGTQDVGQCLAGLRSCRGGQWSACEGEVTPSPTEVCDGIDNDCNGHIDENLHPTTTPVFPVPVTGFNIDVIAEASPLMDHTTGVVDGASYILYTASLYGSLGLPDSGTITEDESSWQLAPFDQPNALKLAAGESGTLELASASGSAVSLLGFSTEGTSTVSVVIHTASGPLPAQTFSMRDWFDGDDIVLSYFGRVKRTNGNRNGDRAPYLSAKFLEVGCSAPLPTIRKVEITNTSTGSSQVLIFGVSVGQ